MLSSRREAREIKSSTVCSQVKDVVVSAMVKSIMEPNISIRFVKPARLSVALFPRRREVIFFSNRCNRAKEKKQRPSKAMYRWKNYTDVADYTLIFFRFGEKANTLARLV